MFGIFKRKKAGPEIELACDLAENLLGSVVSKSDIREIANSLAKGPIPYSTHDLAVSTALNFFSRSELWFELESFQIAARSQALTWFKENKVAPILAQAFEHKLYTMFRSPPNPSLPSLLDHSEDADEAKALQEIEIKVQKFRAKLADRSYQKAAQEVVKFYNAQSKRYSIGTIQLLDDHLWISGESIRENINKAFLFGAMMSAKMMFNLPQESSAPFSFLVLANAFGIDAKDFDTEIEGFMEASQKFEEFAVDGHQAIFEYLTNSGASNLDDSLLKIHIECFEAAKRKIHVQ